jgi:deoxyinosine 3'endonuclease (endonuclease V)
MAPRPQPYRDRPDVAIQDVIGAEVLKEGVRIDYIPGCWVTRDAELFLPRWKNS